MLFGPFEIVPVLKDPRIALSAAPKDRPLSSLFDAMILLTTLLVVEIDNCESETLFIRTQTSASYNHIICIKEKTLYRMINPSITAAALLSTGFISLVPNVILLLFPSYGAGEGGQSKFLSLGQAMSAGGLLGDVFLHTLGHDDHHHHEHHQHEESPHGGAGLWVLCGFTVFLAADMLIRALDPGKHHHDHSDDHKHVHRELHQSTVLLNLAADALHNFTDGLAIGASYAVYGKTASTLSIGELLRSRGGLASVSVLFHEVPHELGDFCTLVRAGYSRNQAIAAQFVTAVAAFLGTASALYLSEEWDVDILLFITAGGFLYLAATTLLPEVLEEDQPISFRALQLASFVTGIAFLYMVSYIEEHDHTEKSHHSEL